MTQSPSVQHNALSIAIAVCVLLAGCPEPIAAGSGSSGSDLAGIQADGDGSDGPQAVNGEPAEVVIPAGAFWMGCSPLDTACAAEKPQHEVILAKYAIDLYETTVAEYANCVAAGACTKPPDASHPTEPFNFGASGREQHPINGVTWSQALAYCLWRGATDCLLKWRRPIMGFAARAGCKVRAIRREFGPSGTSDSPVGNV